MEAKKTIDLSEFFITHSQANDFAIRLNVIVEQMYTTNFNLEQAIHKQFGIQKADTFLKLLREQSLQNASMPQIQAFLKKLQDTVNNLTVVSLTLAFEPTDDVLRSLAQWFSIHVQNQIVLDIQTDPHIIAGIKINYNGRFKDYSLGSVFNALVTSMLHPEEAKPPLHQNAQLITIGR